MRQKEHSAPTQNESHQFPLLLTRLWPLLFTLAHFCFPCPAFPGKALSQRHFYLNLKKLKELSFHLESNLLNIVQ